MTLIDANLLLYATVTDFPQHTRARTWLEDLLGGYARVGMPWQTLTAYLRIVTNPRVFPRPASTAAACERVSEWLELANVWTPTPTERHHEVFLNLVRTSGATANLISDAHLAALAIEHGLELASTDGDFARFRGLRWVNPLTSAP